MPVANILPDLRDLVIAYALSLPIAWNREKMDRSAGLRTFPLVAVASCGFLLAAEGTMHGRALARVVQGVIEGIGFIGGGAILKHHESVHGTATAASLWATAAIGVAVALHAYAVAVIIAAVTFATLRLLSPLKPAPRHDTLDS